ncbi:DUF6531 domain-containing protein [Streptomyces sp. DSM 44915]|uniref:DUF6531 domain-containing protein n=1 Tax=Streptomyces chisholmiae TaxID=3075540 RepID=A0ABU2JPC7_9ACTN|nr:DUF6531 domain-containing protein [Streptomyces sp. DSM 44915]MDT0266836.1 DUF6531 domain-containing protein [Streptomyces sp. DSM 44915]
MTGSPLDGAPPYGSSPRRAAAHRMPPGAPPGVATPACTEPDAGWQGPWLGPIDPVSGRPRLGQPPPDQALAPPAQAVDGWPEPWAQPWTEPWAQPWTGPWDGPSAGSAPRPAAHPPPEAAPWADPAPGLAAGPEGWPVPGPDGVDPVRARLRLAVEDLRLPGVLPLVLARHHRGRTRAGRAFGLAWASNLDQRLLLRDSSVRLVTETGGLLDYPAPAAGSGPPGPAAPPALPLRGPRWPLVWDGTPGGAISVRRPDLGLTLRFRPLAGGSGAELPLVAVVDSRGNALDLRHDARGRLTEVTHSGGYRLGIDSDAAGRIVEVRLLSAAARPALLRCRYDHAGNLTEVEDAAGSVEGYVYDGNRAIVEFRDRAGDVFRYRHDPAGRVTAVAGPRGFRSRLLVHEGRHTTVTDALGHRWLFERDPAGRLAALTDPLGQVTRYATEADGRSHVRTDALGRTTEHRHDPLGHRTETIWPDGTRRTVESDEHGRPVRLTAEDGARTELTRDAHGDVTAVTTPDGRTVRLDYHAGGGLAAVTDALGARWRYACDRAGLPLTVTDPAGEVTRLTRDERGAVVRITGPRGGQRRLERDAVGRLASVTEPSGAAHRWRRDPLGRPLSHTDPAGATTEWARGPLGVCRTLVRPDGGTLSYRHDAELRLIQVTDPAGREWEYAHDAAGRLTEMADVGERPLRLRHDAAGQCVGWTNGAGQRVSLRLDARGRVTERRTEAGLDRFGWDPVGRLSWAESSEARLTVERDGAGAVLAETVNDRTVVTERDAAGRPVRRRLPSGAETRYAYDPAGRLVGLTAEGHRVALELDPDGREVARRIDGAEALRQSWDADGRLTEQILLAGTARRRGWTYRADGALTGSTDEVTGAVAYRRDAAGRPLWVRESAGEVSFHYDRLGQLAGPEREFAGPLLVADASGAAWRQDARGRVVSVTRKLPSGAVGTCHYTWDALDRLTDVVMPDGRHWHYVHDPLGRRVAKHLLDEFGEVRERSLTDWSGGLPVARTEPDGSVTSWHWAPDDHRRPLVQTESGGRGYALVTDPAGTPTELVDERGDVVWRRRATPWGAPTGQGSDTAHCPLGFPGQLYDEETGLFYDFRHGHRYYDPADARYLSPVADPAAPFTPPPRPV